MGKNLMREACKDCEKQIKFNEHERLKENLIEFDRKSNKIKLEFDFY